MNNDVSREMTRLAIKALEDKKGSDIRVIDIKDVSVIADYFIIANGNSNNQVHALSDSVENELGRAGFTPKRIEGYSSASWILMDYNDIIVHIFSKESRIFYDLEHIWKDGTEIAPGEFGKQ